MDIKLQRASVDDAENLWKMQVIAFKDLLSVYQDYDTNPANEKLERTIERLSMAETGYYYIICDEMVAGAIRVVDKKDSKTPKRISPLWIMPEFRGKGIAQQAILKVEEIHGADNWELSTIKEEKGNCYLYEKMGYKLTGQAQVINDKMTLVFYAK